MGSCPTFPSLHQNFSFSEAICAFFTTHYSNFLAICHVFCPCDYLHSCSELKEERSLASMKEKNKSYISGNEKVGLYLGLREVGSGNDGKQFLKKDHNLKDSG